MHSVSPPRLHNDASTNLYIYYYAEAANIGHNMQTRVSHFCRYNSQRVFTLSTQQENPLMGTLKPQSNGQQYRDWYTGHLWVGCYFGTVRRGLGGQAPPCCTKCYSLSINGQCTNFILFDVAL